MRRFIYLSAILLIISMIARADETITVSATNSDISANLDLKVVAKLFGEAKDLEDFEQRLNNPDSAFVNLDLNGDGDVDYIRVIETTGGNKHLIVLQAVLAKDIYQDVASIYVEKDETTSQVSVQVIGDEYIYGTNYVIEPVYIYRPVIYDWFWSPYWVCWNSPWYWGYWPHWWHTWGCIHYWAYWDHCHHFHHHHGGCSFHYAQSARPASRTMSEGVSRQDYATANPGHSFVERNSGRTNARQLPYSTRSGGRSGDATSTHSGASTTSASSSSASGRTYGSAYTGASTRNPSTSSNGSHAVSTRPVNSSSTRPANSGSSSSATTRNPSANSNGNGSHAVSSRPVNNSSSSRPTYSSSSSSTSRPAGYSNSSTTRSPSSSNGSHAVSTRPSSYSGHSSGSYSGSHSSGSYSGGGGASTRGGGGGGASTRR